MSLLRGRRPCQARLAPGSWLLPLDAGSPRPHEVLRHAVEHGPLDPDGVQLREDGRERRSLRYPCRGNPRNGLFCWRGACRDPERDHLRSGCLLFVAGGTVQGFRAKWEVLGHGGVWVAQSVRRPAPGGRSGPDPLRVGLRAGMGSASASRSPSPSPPVS